MSYYEEERNDKKLIYILLGVIAVLLIVAITVVIYLTFKMKFIEETSKVKQQTVATQPAVVQPVVAPKPHSQSQVVQESVKRVEAASASGKVDPANIAAIVQMVVKEMEAKQSSAKPAKTTPSSTQEDDTLATIASALDAPSTPEPKQSSTATQSSGGDELEEVLSILKDVDVDSVDEIEITPEKIAPSVTKTQAKKSAKVIASNFNKVVITPSQNDALSQLENEISQLEGETSSTDSNYEKAIKKEVAERENEMRTIVVKEGDTLSSIAKRAYGNAMKFDKILKANPEIIKSPDRIFVGQVLRVPK